MSEFDRLKAYKDRLMEAEREKYRAEGRAERLAEREAAEVVFTMLEALLARGSDFNQPETGTECIYCFRLPHRESCWWRLTEEAFVKWREAREG